ncbi:endonuclease/exonuclease/phosphatase family protein [Brevundimonas sp.]|uniref:endonuclease/exonuclease/phosphatase family protein n=1 Tax=Brevundimonas sp. TaxID=1871086 RepID=UPI0025D417A0|nr:endonuclease/exonuclease/phosphatase family protein [Brevundimonas sp.]
MNTVFKSVWSLVVWGASLGLLAGAGLALARLDHHAPDLVVLFAKPMLTCAVAWFVLTVLMRRPGPALVTLAACAGLVASLAPYAPSRSGGGEADLRLYVANTWARNEDTDRLAASIAAAEPDVVVLVELGDAAAAALDGVLADYPHRVVTRRVDRPSGAARSVVASRWPISSIQEDVMDGLPVVAAEVETPAGPVRVFGLHLTRPWPFQPTTGQIWQIDRLTERLGAHPTRTVVAGDFNAPPPGRALRHALGTTGLELASDAHGTWPALAPGPLRLAIDHVLASPDIRPLHSEQGAPTGSDHRPVIVDLDLP